MSGVPDVAADSEALRRFIGPTHQSVLAAVSRLVAQAETAAAAQVELEDWYDGKIPCANCNDLGYYSTCTEPNGQGCCGICETEACVCVHGERLRTAAAEARAVAAEAERDALLEAARPEHDPDRCSANYRRITVQRDEAQRAVAAAEAEAETRKLGMMELADQVLAAEAERDAALDREYGTSDALAAAEAEAAELKRRLQEAGL